MIRDGPGGSVAAHRPSGPVVTVASGVNAFDPLSGAASTVTGWPASGSPALLVSSPCTLTGRPKPTVARLASLGVEELHSRWGCALRRMPAPALRAGRAVCDVD